MYIESFQSENMGSDRS